MSVQISVVTVTHDRPAALRRKLDSLVQQSLDPERFEWIVCANGADDGTLRTLQGPDLPFCLKLIVEREPRSIAMARNACARQASGRWLYLSDDDCMLPPDTLERHLKAQQRRPGVAIGAVVFEDGARSRTWRPRRVHYWNLNGANVSLPHEAFEAVGGFDEALEGYGGEDVLLGYRLWRQGLSFDVLPEAAVRHLGPDPARAGDARKARSAGSNAVRIAARHPELAFRLGVHPALLSLKRVLLGPPLGRLWRSLDRASYVYERAYLDGALEERR